MDILTEFEFMKPEVKLISVTPDAEKHMAYCARVSNPANQEEGSLDKRSGDYLLTSVRQVLYRDDKDFKYECVLECKSDSHSKSAPSGTGGIS